MNVAVVHDWLTGMRGGEKVLEGILELFPQAEIFTLIHVPGSVSGNIESHRIHTSFLQAIPGIRKHYRKFLPLFPLAISRLNLAGFDLIVSSSHCVAKGVRVPTGVPHLCYCHTPMRYIWDHYDTYFGAGRASRAVRLAMASTVGYLRRWDLSTANRVSLFVANSHYVAERIQRLYKRQASVLHPWVDHERFTPAGTPGNEYLMVTALVPYKAVELAIAAFGMIQRPLIVAGSGPLLQLLSARAPDNIRFLGWVSDDDLPDLYRQCRALIFPGEEDFGIVPLEAMSCGRPVIAYEAGGALETVLGGKTGCFFCPQTPDALVETLLQFETAHFDSGEIRAHAMKFDRARFLREFSGLVARVSREAGDRL